MASAQDSKSILNCFCQKQCKRPVTKQDIVYEVMKYGEQYQATVTLHCLEDVQFAGEVASTPKQAEQNAAQIALTNYASEVQASMAAPKAKAGTKRKADIAFGMGGMPGGDGLASLALTGLSPISATPAPEHPGGENSSRVVLNNFLMRYLKRPLTKEDVNYNTVQTALGFQCTVSMPCLSGEWAGLGWAGEVAGKKKQAEENAAQQAVEALSADPELSQAMSTTAKAQKTSPAAGGKGKGGGKWGGMFGPEMFAMMAMLKGKAKGKGCGPQDMFTMMSAMMMKGKGKGKNGLGPKPRTRISADPTSGTIAEWKGKFGWIQPLEPIEHEAAARNKGRLFLHIKDWNSEAMQPAEGLPVMFYVYSDPTGLGAEDCGPL